SAAGRATALALVERADVLVEGFRPGVTERLGLGPEDCAARNPRLVYARMTGWGQQGPLADRAGHDITYLAVTGLLDSIGRAGAPPTVPLNLVGDFGGGSLYLVVGVLSALLERERSGHGQVVDAAIVDGASHLASAIWTLHGSGRWKGPRGTNRLDSGAPFYDVYATADGGHMAVGAIEPQFYALLLAGLGLDPADLPAQDDPAGWPELRETLATAFAARTRAEWTAVFEGTDACVAPVVTLSEAPRHPHLAARGTLAEHDGIVAPAPAPRFSRSSPGEPQATRTVEADVALAAWAGGGTP
ncbi:CaiB/BaiF CoA transferase family protein, partial [Pseudonocardia pini]|uniref:CaiB/BaiF CoA transferase family protein n=1 Tax=Pseudonocardia pini TaxID=2758030 RepID=UPI0015F0BCDC